MQNFILIGSAIFCFLHSYRDWLHSKKNFNSWFTRVGHYWDAPQYEIHGMIFFFIAGCILLAVAIS